jgi:hypothetical protein
MPDPVPGRPTVTPRGERRKSGRAGVSRWSCEGPSLWRPGAVDATTTAAATSRQTVRPSVRPAGWCRVHCGILRCGTTTAPTNAPSRPKYEPVMKLRCNCTRCVRAAHSPIDSVTKVNTDRPWIHEK